MKENARNDILFKQNFKRLQDKTTIIFNFRNTIAYWLNIPVIFVTKNTINEKIEK